MPLQSRKTPGTVIEIRSLFTLCIITSSRIGVHVTGEYRVIREVCKLEREWIRIKPINKHDGNPVIRDGASFGAAPR